MASYEVGFCALSAVEILDPAAPPARVPHAPAPSRFAPGAGFRLDSTAGLLTCHVTQGAVSWEVAEASPWGVAGAPVDLGPSFVAEGPEGRVTCALLRMDAVAVGLVSDRPLAATGLYRVQRGPAPVALAFEGVGRPLDLATTGEETRRLVFGFTAGTLIDTLSGARTIETLRPGDLVTTLDNGSQTLRWVGSRRVTRAEMLVRPGLQPIRFDRGTIGNTQPLLLSQTHRMLLSDWRAQVYFGEDQVLIAAKALENGQSICQVLPEADVTYLHLLFDRHEVILAEGALLESFHPGEGGLAVLEAGQRQEIQALFPGQAVERRRAAFPIVRASEARALRTPE